MLRAVRLTSQRCWQPPPTTPMDALHAEQPVGPQQLRVRASTLDDGEPQTGQQQASTRSPLFEAPQVGLMTAAIVASGAALATSELCRVAQTAVHVSGSFAASAAGLAVGVVLGPAAGAVAACGVKITASAASAAIGHAAGAGALVVGAATGGVVVAASVAAQFGARVAVFAAAKATRAAQDTLAAAQGVLSRRATALEWSARSDAQTGGVVRSLPLPAAPDPEPEVIPAFQP